MIEADDASVVCDTRLVSPGIRHGHRTTGIGAIVLGGDYQGLGIVRSLGRRGVPICILDDERSIGRYSRYTTHAVRVPSLRQEAQIVDAVWDTGRRLGLEGWVLYPTREEIVAACSRHRSQLAQFFRVPTPGWNTIQWAWDKRNTYQLANELGIPTPRTWYVHDVADLEHVDAEPPFVLKPAIKEHFIYATKAKAWRADSRHELRARLQLAYELVGPGELMIQELIPGDGHQQFAYAAFFKGGQAIGSMVAQRWRQHPPQFGRASTFVETVDIPVLEDLSERFLRAINYYGLVEVEYKRDPRNGEYKVLDVNARTWGYHTLGPRAGVDFPYLLFADQIGETVASSRGKPGIRWVRLISDLATGFVMIRDGNLDWRAYLRSLLSAHTEAVFSREDPLPGLTELALIPYLMVKRAF
jgi:predicted ATP-grasp superfamily ATP-dependent carboligase